MPSACFDSMSKPRVADTSCVSSIRKTRTQSALAWNCPCLLPNLARFSKSDRRSKQVNDSDAFSMDFDGNSTYSFSRDPGRQLLTPPYVRVYAAGPLTNIDSQVTRDCIEVRAIL